MSYFISLLFIFLCFSIHPLSLSAQNITQSLLSLHSGTIFGDVQFTYAQWLLAFDQDIHFVDASYCAAGLCRPELSPDAVAQDPCFPGCDFSLLGPSCGQAFVAANASCQAHCDALKPRYCANPQLWIPLTLDVESDVLHLASSSSMLFRFNFFDVCQAFKVDLIIHSGDAVFLVSNTNPLPSYPDRCFLSTVTFPWSYHCPSAACYSYGTYYINVLSVEPRTDAVFSIIVRSQAVEPGPRRTSPPENAPATLLNQISPFHTPVQFGVPMTLQFGHKEEGKLFQLTTDYCGHVLLQLQVGDFAPDPVVNLGVWFSSTKPIPGDLINDYWFTNSGFKPIWVCPAPNQTYAVVFMTVIRFLSGVPLKAGIYPGTHYFTVDTLRPELAQTKYTLGTLPQDLHHAHASDNGKHHTSGGVVVPQYSKHLPFPQVMSWQAAFFSNTVNLVCGGPKYNTSLISVSCKQGPTVLSASCVRLFGAYPTDPFPQGLLPIPKQVRMSLPLFANLTFSDYIALPQRKVLPVVLLLEVRNPSITTILPLGPDWPSVLPTCRLTTGLFSPFQFDSGSWIFHTFQETPTEPVCDYEEFQMLSEQIDEFIHLADRFATRALTYRYLTDLQTFNAPWIACQRYVEEVLMITNFTHLRIPDTTSCIFDEPDSPCCSNTLGWLQCCSPRLIEGDVLLPLQANGSATGSCRDANCTNQILGEYSQSAFLLRSGLCETNNLNQLLHATNTIMHDCFRLNFGDDLEGLHCSVDADCPSSATIGLCDHIENRCVQSQSASTASYFQCLEDNIPISVQDSLTTLPKHAPSFAAGLAEVYSTNRCVNVAFNHPGSNLRDRYVSNTAGPGCPPCTITSLDLTQPLPPWCDARVQESVCSYRYEQHLDVATTAQCVAEDTRCNWDPDWRNTDPTSDCLGNASSSSSSSPSSSSSDYYCGVFESDIHILPLPGVHDAVACAALENAVCALADGTFAVGVSAAQCRSMLSCDQECAPGVPCATESACLATGECIDTEMIRHAMINSDFWLVKNPPWTGFCSLPMRPYNVPDCSSVYYWSLPSSFGCVIFGDCRISNGNVRLCDLAYLNQSDCETRAKGTWHPAPTTQAECEQDVGCNDILPIASTSTYGSTLYSPKSPTQCSLCNGEVRPINQWIPGRWLPGDVRSPVWIPRALQPIYNISGSVNFHLLQRDIDAATAVSAGFQLLNNLQCTYQSTKQILSIALCDCLANLSDCFPTVNSQSVGVGHICPGLQVNITAPPFTIIPPPNLPASAGCLDFTLTRHFARNFDPINPPPISTGFIPHNIQPISSNDFQSVLNSNGAVVGQVIGDGLEIHFNHLSASSSPSAVRITLCVYPSRIIPIDPKFTVLDFGSFNGNYEVTPLHYPSHLLAENTSYPAVCASTNLRLTETSKLVPILRLEDDLTPTSSFLSDGGKACLYVVASLYAVLFLIVICVTAYLLSAKLFSFAKPKNYLWFTYSLHLVIRSIYLYLAASGIFGQSDKNQLVEFWMIELPIILYLISNLIIGLSFFFLHRLQESGDSSGKSTFRITLFTTSFLLIMLFISILLAFNYEVVVPARDVGSLACPKFNDTSSTARTIRIIYISLILAIASIVATIELVMGLMLYNDIRKMTGASRILRLTLTSSVGILSDSIAYLIYYIIDNPSPYYSIVLIFTEIIPIAGIVFILSYREIKTRISTRETHDSHNWAPTSGTALSSSSLSRSI